MNRKKVSAVIFGIFLLNGLLTCSLGQDIPPDFFIDETRQPSVVIVVGSKAASEDVASAVLLAAKVACACRERPGNIPLTGASMAVHENIASLVKGAWVLHHLR
jgi:S-layer protein (TIGR01564 family)